MIEKKCNVRLLAEYLFSTYIHRVSCICPGRRSEGLYGGNLFAVPEMRTLKRHIGLDPSKSRRIWSLALLHEMDRSIGPGTDLLRGQDCSQPRNTLASLDSRQG
jgi:hypothetical protein